MPTTDAQAKFEAFIKTKEVAAWLAEFPVEGTKAAYSSALFRYWSEELSKKYATLWDWIVAVKARRKSDDMMTRKGWALDVLSYTKTQKGVGGRPMATASKELLSSAVKSFLRAWDGDVGSVELIRRSRRKVGLQRQEYSVKRVRQYCCGKALSRCFG